jgi:hypothetical protein
VFHVDEFGPGTLRPRPGRQRAGVSGKNADPKRGPRRRRRTTYRCTQGVRHLLAANDLGPDRLHGHVKPVRNRSTFLAFWRY